MNVTITQIDPLFGVRILPPSGAGGLSLQQIETVFGLDVAPGAIVNLGLTLTTPIAVALALPGSLSWGGGGSSSGGGVTTYIFNQVMPAAVWDIAHRLGRFPSVDVVDSTGRMVEGDVEYRSANEIVLTFSAAFAGVAYLN